MGDAIVKAVVEQLISATTEWLKNEISVIKGVEEELENMISKMQTIQKVLDDAENKSMKEKTIKQWLEKLQYISYDMEDVMDEWNTRVLKQKMEDPLNDEISSSCLYKSTCFSFKKSSCFSSVKQVGWRRDIAMRIKEINKRINMLSSQVEQLDLFSKVSENNVMSSKGVIDRTTTSSIEESLVHGRDEDNKFLLSKVLWQRGDEINNTQMIVIVGVGGLGKTTLAQLVYNDEMVKQKFDHRTWVCVSNPFDELKVAQGILEGFGVNHYQMTHLQTLHEAIIKNVSNKKLLLVLDDVWDEDSVKWERLRMCLKCDAPESRIIVTTRSEEVAKIMSLKPTNIFRPTLISDSDCWLLMSHAAFQGKEEKDSQLENIGRMIANKCKGLPLAAKVLGGLLRSKDTLEEWKQVLNSEIWELERVEVELFPHLFLSYKELSSSLKRCFSLCAFFPKDYSIGAEELVSFWMAQIHLDSRIIKDEMMLVGQRYIKFLKSGAFLEEGEWKDSVKMHDIMHDFALHLSGHEFLSLVEVNKSDRPPESQAYDKNMKARHLIVDGTVNPSSVCDVGKLRTILVKDLPQNVTLDLFKQLKVVRAMYLQNCDLEQIPEEIGKLIHLRVLDLNDNWDLLGLPETIGELYNLEYLGIHLEVILPKSLRKLVNLQGLKEVRVERDKSNLGMLRNLNKLRKDLKIVFTSDYSNEVDAIDAKLRSKKFITELSFDFRCHEVTNGVFEALEVPLGVQVLSISNFIGERFLPNWITSLPNLKELTLSKGVTAMSIPPLGKLPSLERLYVEDFPVLKFIGRDFLGITDDTSNKQEHVSFPNLLTLKLLKCPELEEWEDIEAEVGDTITIMPKLKCLEIINCDKLKALPHHLICKAASLDELTSSLSFDVHFSSVQQPPKLQLLKIRYFEGLSLPNWIVSLNHLTKLHIEYGFDLEYFPPLGKLPCLEYLSLRYFFVLESIGREFLGMDKNSMDSVVAFPKLVKFSLWICNELKEWEDVEAEEADKIIVMPNLESLEICSCNHLEALPSRLLCKAPRLQKLTIKTSNTLLEDSVRGDQQLRLHIEKIHLNDSLLMRQPRDLYSTDAISDQQG